MSTSIRDVELLCDEMIVMLAFLLDQHNRIGGVMVSVLASIVVDHGFEPWSGQTKDYEIGFNASPLSTQHEGKRAKIGWIGIRKICPSGTTCLSADCCFRELRL
jgi:hypothetical protein